MGGILVISTKLRIFALLHFCREKAKQGERIRGKPASCEAQQNGGKA
jgi:hypothetical protein